MANIEIKDGEYTKTIYSMIKEQRYDNLRNRYIVLMDLFRISKIDITATTVISIFK